MGSFNKTFTTVLELVSNKRIQPIRKNQRIFTIKKQKNIVFLDQMASFKECIFPELNEQIDFLESAYKVIAESDSTHRIILNYTLLVYQLVLLDRFKEAQDWAKTTLKRFSKQPALRNYSALIMVVLVLEKHGYLKKRDPIIDSTILNKSFLKFYDLCFNADLSIEGDSSATDYLEQSKKISLSFTIENDLLLNLLQAISNASIQDTTIREAFLAIEQKNSPLND